ncbi:MAG: NADPH-dependent F420 reductase [Halobacteriaceae archaeon]
MEIALLGGTGDIGEGLALRWAYHTNHDIVIGSREVDRAQAKAREYEAELDSRGLDAAIGYGENADAAGGADVVVTAVPAYHVRDCVEAVGPHLDREAVLVTPAVGLTRDEAGCHFNPPSIGSCTELVADAAPSHTPVVGAYHTLAAGRLADLDAELDVDTVLLGDDPDAKETVRLLTDGIDGVRPLDGGPIANAAPVESLTALLVTLPDYNPDLADVGVKFH